jgi:hypothetical protein
MGVRYKGSQGQTKRTVELQEEEEKYQSISRCMTVLFPSIITVYTATNTFKKESHSH